MKHVLSAGIAQDHDGRCAMASALMAESRRPSVQLCAATNIAFALSPLHLWRTEVLAEHAQRATELACGELARRRGNPRLAGPSSGGRYGGRPSPWGPWGAITALAGRRLAAPAATAGLRKARRERAFCTIMYHIHYTHATSHHSLSHDVHVPATTIRGTLQTQSTTSYTRVQYTARSDEGMNETK